MLARLTLGFFLLACGALVAACSSSSTTPSSGGVPGIGPNFAPNSIYVADTTGSAIEIYNPSPAPSASPPYAIVGSNTTLAAPQYLMFDSNKHLYVTNYNPETNTGAVVIFQTYATGNVIPLNTINLGNSVHPHGIAPLPNNAGYALAATSAGGFFTDAVFTYTSLGLQYEIAGSNTGLNHPIGVAVDANRNIYVSNDETSPQAPNVSIYALPTGSPSPTPSASPTPSPTPSPSPTPVGATPSPSPTPSPTPTPASLNEAPTTTITGSFVSPEGIALDSAGNLYVADNGQPTARILIFDGPFAAGTQALAPSAVITSSSLVNPVDVKLDSNGTIYVIDQGLGPSAQSKLLIFPAGTTGNATPSATVLLPGTDTGIALSP